MFDCCSRGAPGTAVLADAGRAAKVTLGLAARVTGTLAALVRGVGVALLPGDWDDGGIDAREKKGEGGAQHTNGARSHCPRP